MKLISSGVVGERVLVATLTQNQPSIGAWPKDPFEAWILRGNHNATSQANMGEVYAEMVRAERALLWEL